jgi:hypothetical protein
MPRPTKARAQRDGRGPVMVHVLRVQDAARGLLGMAPKGYEKALIRRQSTEATSSTSDLALAQIRPRGSARLRQYDGRDVGRNPTSVQGNGLDDKALKQKFDKSVRTTHFRRTDLELRTS